MLERTIVKKIMDHLKASGGYCVKFHGNCYTQAGTPDILACLDGRFLALEVKRPGGKPTPLQAAQLRRWQEAGALAAVVCSVADVVELLSDSPTDEQKALRSNPRAVDNKREGV